MKKIELHNIAENLIKNSKSINSDVQGIINKEFWNLI